MASKSTIPDFTDQGLLPPGIYLCNFPELEDKFVSEFENSTTRPSLIKNFHEWCGQAEDARITYSFHWIDGSFVEKKTDPNDIDVATFIHVDDVNSMPVVAKSFIERWIKNGRAQDRFSVDGAYFPFCGKGHPRRHLWEHKKEIYKKIFGYNRSGLAKGFLQSVRGDVPENRVLEFEQ